MTVPEPLLFLAAIREPARALEWTIDEWERNVRLSRRLRLLARLAAGLEAQALLGNVPAPARRHLVSELRLSRWRVAAMRWALVRVGDALAGSDHPIVLLKGAAYIGQDLSIARGRMPADVDILVPQRHIAAAQDRLKQAGWQEVELDAHDQRYDREWSHEVPPMRHPVHRIELDLHHNVLPPVARIHVNADRLLERVRPCLMHGWTVFDPVDQFLHAAAHLFCDSELRDRIRDLVDLDELARHFGATDSSFWDRLHPRAIDLGLSEPLALAAHFLLAWFDTPIPAHTQSLLRHAGPGAVHRAWLVPLMTRVLMPVEPDQDAGWAVRLADTLVLARYHRNRMPVRLLVPHLLHKATGRDQARVPPDETLAATAKAPDA